MRLDCRVPRHSLSFLWWFGGTACIGVYWLILRPEHTRYIGQGDMRRLAGIHPAAGAVAASSWRRRWTWQLQAHGRGSRGVDGWRRVLGLGGDGEKSSQPKNQFVTVDSHNLWKTVGTIYATARNVPIVYPYRTLLLFL